MNFAADIINTSKTLFFLFDTYSKGVIAKIKSLSTN